MQFKITPQQDTCITEELDVDLGKYTIFAGENNNGKSSILKAIKEHDIFENYKKIYVPAENIQPQNSELKNTAVSDSFYKLIKSILGPIFDRNIFNDLISRFDASQEKKDFVDGVNNILKDFGVDKKELGIKIAEDKFKEDVIIKIAKAFVKDLYKSDVDEVDFEKIGMGTQRLLVAALIRYYQEKSLGGDDNLLVIVEEPEIYLHPRWKNSLYNSLKKLAERPNTFIVISTHDPHFIELGRDQKIYKVYRDEAKKDAASIEEVPNNGILKYRSEAEINYQVLNFPSKIYFLELYEHAKDLEEINKGKEVGYFDFDGHIFNNYFQAKGMVQSEKDYKGRQVTPLTRLRHDLAHGENSNPPISIEDAITSMKDFITH